MNTHQTRHLHASVLPTSSIHHGRLSSRGDHPQNGHFAKAERGNEDENWSILRVSSGRAPCPAGVINESFTPRPRYLSPLSSGKSFRANSSTWCSSNRSIINHPVATTGVSGSINRPIVPASLFTPRFRVWRKGFHLAAESFVLACASLELAGWIVMEIEGVNGIVDFRTGSSWVCLATQGCYLRIKRFVFYRLGFRWIAQQGI